jgi:hypothetical protein
MELNVNNAHKDPHDLHHNPLTLPLSPAFGGEGGVRGWAYFSVDKGRDFS